jgi:ubiquinone/menaquinone biosynthesis C-methylase UbiE
MEHQESINIVEIGGGSGNFASIMFHEFSPKILFMVDLPESIVNAFVFLSSVFPEAQIVLPDEVESFLGKLSKGDLGAENARVFVFLTPWQINLLPSDYFDLAVNTHSFQEMTHAQIDEYFSLVERVSKKDGLFFCVNRVEKIPCKGNAYTEVQQEPPNRFYEYPWRPKNVRLIDEISRLHRVCAADNAAIRLERIVKAA